MKKLRLLLWEECDRSCEGCCNKDFDLPLLPVVQEFYGFNQVILTGGEPMLYPEAVLKTIIMIRNKALPGTEVILYTASMNKHVVGMACFVNGITITVHDQEGVENIIKLDEMMTSDNSFMFMREHVNLRLNIFKGFDVDINQLWQNWQIKDQIEWIKDCPLPEDEVFMRMPIGFENTKFGR